MMDDSNKTIWKPVKKDGESLGLTARTVGELKEILKYVPDDYILSACGTSFGIVMCEADKQVLIDDVSFLENLLADQAMEQEG